MVEQRDVVAGVVVPAVCAVIGARDRPPALRWSIAITRYSQAHSIVGSIGAEVDPTPR